MCIIFLPLLLCIISCPSTTKFCRHRLKTPRKPCKVLHCNSMNGIQHKLRYQFTTRYTHHYCSYLQVVREDGNIEKIIFPVPIVCKNLSDVTKQRVLLTTQRDEKGSKVYSILSWTLAITQWYLCLQCSVIVFFCISQVEEFFKVFQELYEEMLIHKSIRSECAIN